MNLDKLFNPRSVAVIGAADDPKKLGYIIVKNLLSLKNRKIYPVNPTFKKVLKLPCLASVNDVKGLVDLAVIVVKPEIVPLVLADCGKKKIPHAIIITAGFKEAGGAGVEREKEIIEIANKFNINLVGPNCLGVIDAQTKLNATFGNDLPHAGNIAFVSQSGALGTAMLDLAEMYNIGFSKFISLGNEAGATENDFLEYLRDDKNTSAVFMYLEGITDGPRFIRLASQVSQKKPVVVLKAGKSERGQKAVASHTGSLAPSHEIFKSACRQSGVILVDSIGEMVNIARLVSTNIKSMPNNWLVLTNGGGPSIIAADLIEAAGNLELTTVSDELKNKLRARLPESAALNNPVDIIGDALGDRYEYALKILTAEKNIGGIIVILTPQKMTQIKETASIIAKYKKLKPIIPMFIGGGSIEPAEKIFKENKLANFIDAAELIHAVSLLAKQSKKKITEIPRHEKTILRQVSYNETNKYLQSVGLSIVGELVEKKDGLANLVKKYSFPWAMKIASAQVIHKTDAGGVATDIKNLPEAEKVWDDMEKVVPMKVPGAKIDGFIVQPMTKGKEVIIGMKRDQTFGPVLLFGLGGVFVEVLKDVAMRIAPIGENEALAMIEETKGAAILKGARGMKSVDLRSLAKHICVISRLAKNNPEIIEIDLNPVMATEAGTSIIDARILV